MGVEARYTEQLVLMSTVPMADVIRGMARSEKVFVTEIMRRALELGLPLLAAELADRAGRSDADKATSAQSALSASLALLADRVTA
jgi:hypothetical protein